MIVVVVVVVCKRSWVEVAEMPSEAQEVGQNQGSVAVAVLMGSVASQNLLVQAASMCGASERRSSVVDTGTEQARSAATVAVVAAAAAAGIR